MTDAGKLNVLLIGCPDTVVRAVSEGGHEAWSSSLEQPVDGPVLPKGIDVIMVDLTVSGPDPFSRVARTIGLNSFHRKPMVVGLAETTNAALDTQCRFAGIDLLFLKPIPPAQVTQFLDRFNTVVQDFESFDPMI